MQRERISIILPKGEKEDYYKIKFVELMRFVIDKYKDKIKFDQNKNIMKLVLINNFESPERVLEFLINFSREIMKLFGAEAKEKSPVDQ